MTDTFEAIDVIDELADITEGGALDTLRRRRPVTRAQLQASSDALFTPLDDSEVSVAERLLVAAFATRLTADDATAARYAALAAEADADRTEIVLAEAAAAAAPGPFGAYVEAGLRAESLDGPRYSPSPQVTAPVGARLAAALAHTQLLVSRPREASGDALDRLLEAGWSTDAIITLSQLISFLAFQQRVATGLRVLAASAGASDIDDDTEEAAA
ncbi:MAG: CMD domain protein [Microbacterium sp.]